ncbi:MAG: SDR family NAD(P)-dependent oxidoreductase [Ilumatobacter sp.]|nr:SDR family oxidoreductase [bacterium]MDG1265897.1 SDR family NAD(P)-dependent oxidoreductase [Ilumatobacter sp.]
MERLTSLSRSINGHATIVTGAASGMGRATAHLFADEGARVVVADLGPERVDAVINEIHAIHGPDSALGIVTDVADSAQLETLVTRSVEWAGRLDILINNAGVSMINSPFQDADEFETSWAQTVDVNLTAHARLVRLALPHLLQSHAARIVNIASTEALVSTAGLGAYAATKAGVVGLTQSLAVELGRHGVTVNAICPGPINTAMTAGIDEESKARYSRRRVPLRRYGMPEEVAQMTLNLCLPASSFVSGAHIPVDGGMSIRHT